MKLLAIFALVLMTSIFGCGHHSSDPLVTNAQTELQNQPFDLQQSYFGENLTLLFPSPNNLGEIKIQGADANTLFEALQVKETREKPTRFGVAPVSRQGQFLKCLEESTMALLSTAKHECSIFFDYRSGSLIQQTANVAVRKSAQDLVQNYTSSHLKLVPLKRSGYAAYTLTGEDARAIFSSLNPQKNPNKRSSGSMECYKTNDSEALGSAYTCTVYFDYRTGGLNSARRP
jgi:hypothetical protein